MVDSYFLRAGAHRYLPTAHVGGAWSADELHVSTVAGLLVHELQLWQAQHGDPDKVISRVTIEILGRLDDAQIAFETRLVRPGRTIELVEIHADIGGRRTLSARAWFMSAGDTTEVAGSEWQRLPAPDQLEEYPVSELWPGGYIASIRGRQVHGPIPGRAAVWLTTDLDLVAGEPVGELARFVALIDTANGIAVRRHPEEWAFPNLDISLHFFRQPTGRWVGLDTTVSFGPRGQGLTSTVLHDLDGPVGTAQQILTLRPR